MKHTNENKDDDYIIEGYVPQEPTKTISFEPFPNDPKFHSISFTRYLYSGNLVFIVSDMIKHENGLSTGTGKGLEINHSNIDKFQTFVKNLYNLTFNKEVEKI